MKRAIIFALSGLIVFTLFCSMGASQAAGPGGGGSFLTALLPFVLLIGIIILIVLAIRRDVKSIMNGGNVPLAVIAIVLSILVTPVGLILSFVVVKKVTVIKE